nr:MAG TPA: hypothetical protein [Caudoviricetes sp.]
MEIKVIAYDEEDKWVRNDSENIVGLEKLEDLAKDEISKKIKDALKKLFFDLCEVKIDEEYKEKTKIKISFKETKCKVQHEKDSYYILELEYEEFKLKVENILKNYKKR